MSASSPQNTSFRNRVILIAVFGPILVVAGVLFCFDPSRYGFYPVCLFHQTTGMLCAGCGATRALYQLMHGHLVTAFRFNPFLVVSLPFIIWYGVRLLVRALKDQPTQGSISPRWLWVLFAVLVAFSVVRNLPGLPPALLPPDAPPRPGLRATR